MCSWATFSPSIFTIEHTATSTRRPVGATPGSIQSISMLCVKRSTLSSTTWSEPTMRDTGTSSMSGGIEKMKWWA